MNVFRDLPMMDESSRRPVQVDGDGAPKRRRLRRLRSWWRHEQQTVAAVLVSARHHSYGRKGMTKVVAHEGSEEVGCVPLDAPQGQITPPPGERSAPLAEVAAPQGLTVARCPVDGGPTLTVPVLAGRAAESVDSSALSFLLSQSILAEQEAKEAEELEANLAAREQQLLEEVERLRTSPTRGARGSPVEAAAAWWSLAKPATRKKKAKRRRKKKLPRGGTRPRMVLPGRRLQHNTWFDSGSFFASVCEVFFCSWHADIISTAPCIWPPFLLRVARGAHNVEFYGRSLPEMFPYSALSGSTVDTYCVSLQRLLGYFTLVVREGALGPCGPFSLPVHTCLLR